MMSTFVHMCVTCLHFISQLCYHWLTKITKLAVTDKKTHIAAIIAGLIHIQLPRLTLRSVFGRLPGPNRAWLLVVCFSHQACQLSLYKSRDYHVYIPNTYQTRPVSCSKTGLYCPVHHIIQQFIQWVHATKKLIMCTRPNYNDINSRPVRHQVFVYIPSHRTSLPVNTVPWSCSSNAIMPPSPFIFSSGRTFSCPALRPRLAQCASPKHPKV